METEQDLTKLKDNEFAPYITLIDPYIFSSDLLHRLQDSGVVAGVLLPSVESGRWRNHYPKLGYSDDTSCPNSLAEAAGDCEQSSPWNPSGQGTMWTSWNFPIFYLENNTFAEEIHHCYSQYNSRKIAGLYSIYCLFWNFSGKELFLINLSS